MKISHRELELCYRDPVKWVKSHHQPGGFITTGYSRVVTMAIYRYHNRHNIDDAVKYLEGLFVSYKLTNITRQDDAEVALVSYINWAETNQPTVAATRINILHSISSGWEMSGEVSRLDVDLTSGGYRAILLGSINPNWQTELRMPLIQQAISINFQRNVSEISVGVQELNGDNLQFRCFNQAELDWAELEAQNLMGSILLN